MAPSVRTARLGTEKFVFHQVGKNPAGVVREPTNVKLYNWAHIPRSDSRSKQGWLFWNQDVPYHSTGNRSIYASRIERCLISPSVAKVEVTKATRSGYDSARLVQQVCFPRDPLFAYEPI